MSTARTLPHSLDAEESLLSAVLLDGSDMLGKAIGCGVTPASFYDPKNAAVFDCLLSLHAEQKPMTVDVVAEELRRTKQLDRVGGWAYLAQVSQKVPTTAEAQFFINRVVEQATLRAVITNGQRLVEECFAFSGDMKPIRDQAERTGNALSCQSEARSWALAVREAESITRERMKPINERNTASVELSWGLSDFDRLFQPMELGELVVIGGYTSSGKSSLLREIAWAVARAGQPAMINTLEVRDSEEAVNLAAHIAQMRSRARLHDLHPKEQADLLRAFETMNVPHFSVCHQDSSIPAICARARAFKRKHGLRFLGIDYLQILEDVKRLRPGERPDFAIGVVTSELKRFATQEETTVCLLSGFNRNYVRDGNRDPVLSDLDGSSNIEKDASRVLLIHVPTEYTLGGAKLTQSLTADASDQPTFFVKVIQAKGRNQGTGCIAMMFHRETKTFRQISRP